MEGRNEGRNEGRKEGSMDNERKESAWNIEGMKEKNRKEVGRNERREVH